ncbi:hypothetical protein ACJ73_09820 [Blastomyces percursus]|uniref:ARS-binding protein 1 N-terminal domain-containing protein n=1 Tax=Blastomyces percursus TaxID=1658174 RepID=A0A1J9P2H4_9EURO|nr:hypothetical protein ACJ73_09820 [Blastomyces percursus]
MGTFTLTRQIEAHALRWNGHLDQCYHATKAKENVVHNLAQYPPVPLDKVPQNAPAISLEQKTALRAHKPLHPAVSHYTLKQWFEAEYKQKIAQSSVPEIFFKRYAHLDKPTNRLPSQKRYRREH